MKREVFLAITVGFILGLIITFGVWTANNSIRNRKVTAQVTPSTSVSPSPVVTTSPVTQNSDLSLTSPSEDDLLVTTPTFTVTGKTTPGNIVTLIYESGQSIVPTDKTGAFSQNITLESGYNRITVTAFDKAGHVIKTDRTVTYTTNKI